LKQQRLDYTLHLADNALILGHRNSEWTGHGPILEQDIALSNIALDLLGQARNFYQYAANIQLNGSTEDSFAYHRNEREFKNALLVELPNGDWGKTILRQFLFSAYQFLLYGRLKATQDSTIAAIAEKSLKEVTYHLRWSSEWVIRLGDGTEQSRQRMQIALDQLWPYSGELFIPTSYEIIAANAGYGTDITLLKDPWINTVNSILQEATLFVPENSWMQEGGKTGTHSEHLGYLLAEMQYLQRSYPNSEW